MAKLLIVEDDEGTLAWMSAALQSLGHEVRGAIGGRSALAALRTWRPDLILSDILMPEMDGLAFARILRRHEDVPVMFVSIAKRQAEAVLLGAVGYVQKPATANEIREAVTRVLGHPEAKNTILVVEDDPDVREIYRSCLEPGFAVIEAENGKVGLERLRERTIDLAVVDVHMPIMNGIELIRAMRDDPALAKVPVIVQTSDLTALRAPIWRDLHVAQVVEKGEFFDWLNDRIVAHVGANVAPLGA
jgi:CheY-like chemotaxis protein